MSKWSNQFIAQYKDTGTVKRLTKDIKNAINKNKMQDQVNKNISDVIKGKYKRKGGKK